MLKNKNWKRWLAYSATIIVTGIVMSVVFQLVTTASLFKFDYDLVFESIAYSTPAYVFSTLVLFIVFILLVLIFNNILFVSIGYLTVTGIVAVLNYIKLNVLVEPIYPADVSYLRNTKDLLSMITSRQLKMIILSVVVLVVLVVVMVFLNRKIGIFKPVYNKHIRVATLISGLVILMLGSSYMMSYNKHDSRFRSYALNNNFFPEYSIWNQIDNYQYYGFLNGFVVNIPGDNMYKPDSYSKETVDKIMDHYTKVADAINASRSRENFEDINVITILSESMSDPSNLDGFILAEEPLEYLKDSSDKVAVGSIISPTYGGQTPNTEYELITGMSYGSLSPAVATAFQSFTSTNDHLPSIFKSIQSDVERDTLAIHSYGSQFFKRVPTYRNFGIDTSIFENDMQHKGLLVMYGYISDESAYNEVLDHYRTNDNPMSIHLVTMQNHAPYPNDFPDSIYGVESELLSDGYKTVVKNYSEGIHRTDGYTKEFVTALNEEEKPYILFFYGDHLPGIYNSILNVNTPIKKYQTNYFMATNLPDASLEAYNTDLISLTNAQNLIYAVGDVKISPYQALVQEVNETFISIHSTGYYLYGDTSPRSYEQLTPYQQKLLTAYEVIQYDLIDGSGYALPYLNQ